MGCRGSHWDAGCQFGMWGVQVYMIDWMEEMQVLGGGPTLGYGGSQWDLRGPNGKCGVPMGYDGIQGVLMGYGGPNGRWGVPMRCRGSYWEMGVPMGCGVRRCRCWGAAPLWDMGGPDGIQGVPMGYRGSQWEIVGPIGKWGSQWDVGDPNGMGGVHVYVIDWGEEMRGLGSAPLQDMGGPDEIWGSQWEMGGPIGKWGSQRDVGGPNGMWGVNLGCGVSRST